MLVAVVSHHSANRLFSAAIPVHYGGILTILLHIPFSYHLASRAPPVLSTSRKAKATAPSTPEFPPSLARTKRTDLPPIIVPFIKMEFPALGQAR